MQYLCNVYHIHGNILSAWVPQKANQNDPLPLWRLYSSERRQITSSKHKIMVYEKGDKYWRQKKYRQKKILGVQKKSARVQFMMGCSGEDLFLKVVFEQILEKVGHAIWIIGRRIFQGEVSAMQSPKARKDMPSMFKVYTMIATNIRMQHQKHTGVSSNTFPNSQREYMACRSTTSKFHFKGSLWRRSGNLGFYLSPIGAIRGFWTEG